MSGDVSADSDGLCLVDIAVAGGRIQAVNTAGGPQPVGVCSNLRRTMVFPCFVDLHTHIGASPANINALRSTDSFRHADKGHTCERSRNPNGTLSGADASTAADAAHWSPADVERRMDFALRCAYAHGTQAVRTHLMSGSRAQFELAWCVRGCASVSADR